MDRSLSPFVTIATLLDEVVALYGEREGVVYPEKGLRWSYRQFRDQCDQVAKGLIKLGVKKGSHLAMWATNHPEWLFTQFASAKAGAVLVTVNTNYRTKELAYLLEQSDAETLILMESYQGASYIEMIQEICPELNHCPPGELQSRRLPRLKNVVLFDGERRPGMFTWKDLLQLGDELPEEELRGREASLSPDDVINMQYTSGTTGFPKGVMLTHANLIHNARSITDRMKLTEADRLCIPVPFFHCFGCVMGTLACVTRGATMVPLIKFDPLRVLESVEKEQCTAIHGVPTMFIAELNHPEFHHYDLSSLRTGIMAGSNCPREVMKKVMEEMGVEEITIAYGQTESSPVITQTKRDDSVTCRVETVGKALPGVEVKVIDPETGLDVSTGAQGEVCTRGPHVMKGYYKMKEATDQSIDTEGWLHTGDLGVLDEEGYLSITGRLKDMIIRGGENIYPREIEEFLYTHPHILDVQVVGVFDEKYGEEVSAFIRIVEGKKLSVDEVTMYCQGQIAHYKIPRFIHFVDAYPMTASGKVQKFKLRQLAEELRKSVWAT
ncbi:AMP-binding protein [Marininema halotolerans]|uniref:Fatty-acyl-CoA synthase n=1 Tax=Marininema halotolerans TaxID=1155944 RepID=A0A1I6SXT7_9BACL|nr:AMP-binding protein [Marininema halotolerans]SFS81781.1 fatty-acyl-CoA synthase [Marininema halotolerans]